MKKKSQPEPEPQPQVQLYFLSSGEVAVLLNESMEDLEELETELNTQFEPQNPHEQFLVDRAIQARWKVYRYRRLETQAYHNLTETEGGDDCTLLDALEAPATIFDKLERLIAAAERAYATAIRELNQYRAQAAKAEKQNKAKPAAGRPQAEPVKIENEPDLQNEPNLEPFNGSNRPILQNEPNPEPIRPNGAPGYEDPANETNPKIRPPAR